MNQPIAMTDEERKVCWEWARWAAECVKEWLDLHDVERVDEEGFVDVITECLNDIGQSNAVRTVRVTPAKSKSTEGT